MGFGAADVPAMSPEQVGQIKRFENYLVSTRGLPTSQVKASTILDDKHLKLIKTITQTTTVVDDKHGTQTRIESH